VQVNKGDSMLSLSRTTRLALRVLAAKADIINLGFPEIISKLIYEKYGALAPLIAKWYKQYRVPESWEGSDWWRHFNWNYREQFSLYALTYLYENSGDVESFLEACKRMEIKPREGLTQEALDAQRTWLVGRLQDDFFKETFFAYYSLIQDIASGKLKDIAPYKRLRFLDAQQKYEKRRYFQESEPIRVYENGFKWIDVGQKSTLLSEQMKNCGSSGLMSMDRDRTILALFGPNGKPHVMVTYSPNEKRISGDECAGSSPVKPEYHSYVIDLAEHMGATFDVTRSKSTELRIKYGLRNKAQSIEPLKTADPSLDDYFRFVVDGEVFYTNGDMVASEEEVNRAKRMMESGELNVRAPQKDAFRAVLLHNNLGSMEYHGIHVIPLRAFLGEGINP
jgi:hypothetical protein